MKMQYEVENKFPVAEASQFEQHLSAMKIDLSAAVLQVDTYFSHPSRDFASTDEALRLRRIGDRNLLAYKGPKIDATTKTRREVEIDIAPGERGAADMTALLGALGFRAVADVRKRRRSFALERGGVSVAGALDEVERLGSFVELEIVANETRVDEAKRQLEELARELKLSNPERRSYLELLIEQEE